MNKTTHTLLTPSGPGAIALIQLQGLDACGIVHRLTGRAPEAQCRVRDLGGIDEGVVVKLEGGGCQIMPHGGPRVVQRLMRRLRELGAPASEQCDTWEIYPEADSRIEADMLRTLTRAASPAAVDLLLDQPRVWREALRAGSLDWERILRSSQWLDRLVHPPTAVLVGRANVGKSTLSNALAGRAAALTADMPGVTRDWVASLVYFSSESGEDVAVRWLDTPGVRAAEDPLEQRALELARDVIVDADLLIAIRDPEHDWPALHTLPRAPDIYVMNKADLLKDEGEDRETRDPKPATLYVSALNEWGLDALGEAVIERLGLGKRPVDLPWAFSVRLRALVEGADEAGLAEYVAMQKTGNGKPGT